MNRKITFALFLAAIAATSSVHAQLKVGTPAGAPTSTLQVAGSVGTDYRAVTASTTLDNTYSVVLANQASGAITITLPTASTCTGRQYTIQNKAANSTTISGGGGVDGGSIVLTLAGQTAVVVSDGTTWNLMSNAVKSTTTPAAVDLRSIGANNHITNDAGIGSNGTSVGTGGSNIAIGQSALSGASNTAGNQIAIGSSALASNTSGSQNTAIGSGAAGNLTSGSNNIALGYNTNLASTTGSNQLNIGNAIFGTGLTGSVSTPAGSIGINTAAPAATLDVNGTARIGTLISAPATDSVVTVDAASGILHKRTITDLINNSGVATNIYNGDGTLTSARTVTMGANTLNFSGARVGFGITPASSIHINNGLNAGYSINAPTSSNAAATQAYTSYPEIMFGQGGGLTKAASVASYDNGQYGGGLVFLTHGNGTDNWPTNVIQSMIITPIGNVGIGTNAPGSKLEVLGTTNLGGTTAINGALSANSTSLFNGATTVANTLSQGSATAGYAVSFNNSNSATSSGTLTLNNSAGVGAGYTFLQCVSGGSGEVGSIRRTAGGVAFNTTSDIRLKDNIKATHYTIADLMKIDVKDYTYKVDASKTPQTGFIAQQLYTIFPNAVSVGGADAKNHPWMVDYSKVTPLLVKSIQDQQTEIAQQQAINALQQAEIDELKAANAKLTAAAEHNEATEKEYAQLAEQVKEMQQMLGMSKKALGAKVGKN